ncbi:MAG: ECF transporter S component [Ruminococcaceae bacterium]|nr:ECF transporter S component [Oscillospiraceae bacterium]
MNRKHANAIKYIAKVAVLTAAAVIIMLFEFPLPFTPPFYKIDLSEVVVFIGGFALGPGAAVLIELLKNLLNLLLDGTTTAFVGEAANFITGCVLVVPAAFIYRGRKSLKSAILGMTIGTVSLAVVGSLLNYFVLIPTYVEMYKMPLDAIIEMASAVNGAVTDLKSMIVFAVVPFNLVKGIICSILAGLLYKRVSGILHR